MAAWVGKLWPLVVLTSMSPAEVAANFTPRELDSVLIAAVRWFSRSAVSCPAPFNCMIWSESDPIVFRLALMVATSDGIACSASWRVVW